MSEISTLSIGKKYGRAFFGHSQMREYKGTVIAGMNKIAKGGSA